MNNELDLADWLSVHAASILWVKVWVDGWLGCSNVNTNGLKLCPTVKPFDLLMTRYLSHIDVHLGSNPVYNCALQVNDQVSL